MKTYRTSDGDLIMAATSRDVVKSLRDSSRDGSPNVDDFMKSMATRVRRQTGKQIASDSAADFVEGLLRAGLLEDVSDRDLNLGEQIDG